MVDQIAHNSEREIGGTSSARWRDRLSDARWILMATAISLFYFVGTAAVTLTQGFVSFALITAVAAVFPRRANLLDPVIDSNMLLSRLRREAAAQFADTLGDPCFLLDQRAAITHANPAATKQFPESSIGDPIAFSIRNPKLLAAIERVRAGGEAEVTELHQTIPAETWFEVNVAPLALSSSDSRRPNSDWVAVIMHNLADQRRVDAMRVDFVANASHELRTPLTSLIGFIDTLQGPAANDPEARERFLTIMRAQAERMSNLVSDLLSLSRIELRQHVRPTDEVNLSTILHEVVEGLQTQAGEAKVKIEITVPEAAVTISGDRQELHEVFENLIDNAIKYGSDGGEIEVLLAPAERAGFDYIVNVVDHGIGISEEHVPRLSERFYRVDADSSRKKKGTGLGLAIVKHILNRHGGQMTIRSQPEIGTDVEILLRD